MLESFLFGVWNGTVFLPTMPIVLIAHFFLNGDQMVGYLDIPIQRASKIRIDIFQNLGEKVIFNATSTKFSFCGFKNGTQLTGIVTSFSVDFPAKLEKIKNKSEYEVRRPQTPINSNNYFEEEVALENKKANLTLSGTFTYPKNKKPVAAVVLCHGSGGLDRDETILDHKPFRVIADYLTRNNIAVLRYDERGIRNSTGDFSSATDVDFAQDAILAIEYLKSRKETYNSRLGLIGHSKGGLTSIIASNRSSNLIDFIALLASPGVTGEDLLYEQTKLILLGQNVSLNTYKIDIQVANDIYKIIKKEQNNSLVKIKIEEYFNESLINAKDQNKTVIENIMLNVLSNINALTSPWFRSFLVFDPANVLVHTKIPVLGLWGANDKQVSSNQNLEPIKNALKLAKNKNFKLITFDKLNHLFQKSTTGLPDEYGLIEETFSVQVLEVIKDWILEKSVEKINSIYDFFRYVFYYLFKILI